MNQIIQSAENQKVTYQVYAKTQENKKRVLYSCHDRQQDADKRAGQLRQYKGVNAWVVKDVRPLVG